MMRGPPFRHSVLIESRTQSSHSGIRVQRLIVRCVHQRFSVQFLDAPPRRKVGAYHGGVTTFYRPAVLFLQRTTRRALPGGIVLSSRPLPAPAPRRCRIPSSRGIAVLLWRAKATCEVIFAVTGDEGEDAGGRPCRTPHALPLQSRPRRGRRVEEGCSCSLGSSRVSSSLLKGLNASLLCTCCPLSVMPMLNRLTDRVDSDVGSKRRSRPVVCGGS